MTDKLMDDSDMEINFNDSPRNRIKFVSIIFCCDSIPGMQTQYMIWRKKKPPFYWTIPKTPLGAKSESEAAIKMLKHFYMIDSDIVTPPMDRYVQIYKKMFRTHEVNFFLVKILNMDAPVHIRWRFSSFSMKNREVAMKILHEKIDRNAIRFYDSYVVPKMIEALSLIGEEQLKITFTEAAKEMKKKQDRDLFKDKIVSISCLMSGNSLTDVMTSPKYQHPFSSETWLDAIKNLSKLGISSETAGSP
ncbi:uncharacterized protein [Halyomorpha halys]|uniref:uncharacterized protein n=1 Tax=Halyomorpha halys TaxID=286706 RepID=UPI0006D4E14C|nr:uncharacterized protein LOC106689751 [Halyomorpha halys]